MKPFGVIIRDDEKDIFFAYVRQFPGICAQADTIEEVKEKIATYFNAYTKRISNMEVEMDDSNIISI